MSRSRATREVWAKRVERWVQSGQQARQFAAEAGINASTLAYWKWRLGVEAKRRTAGPASRSRALAKASVVPPRRAPSPLSFVEITKVASYEPRPIEVELASGERVRVSNDFDEAALGRVLAVLERRR